MKAFVVTAPHEGAIRDVPDPVASEGTVIVDVHRTGICGTDVEFWTGDMAYLHQGHATYPMRLGHEWCGVVSAVGAGVDAVAYDAATQLIFCSNADATTTIIKQNDPDSYTVVQTLSTQYRAKTMALDKATHKIYLSAPKFITGTRNIIPGSFAVLVYKMN